MRRDDAEVARRPVLPLSRGWVLAFWATFALVGVYRDVRFARGPLAGPELASFAVANLSDVGVWIAVGALAFYLTRRRDSVGWREVAKMTLLALLLALANQGVQVLIQCDLLARDCPPVEVRAGWALIAVPTTVAVTMNLFAAAWTVRAAELSARDQVRTETARSELSRAQTRALERRIRPHFLFNTLQSVATLMHRDPAAAREMLLGLRTLLEHSVASGSLAEVSLGEELGFLRIYLDIESWRFGERLRVEYDVDPAALSAGIPPFLLQPLVENAVHHAVAVRGGGRIGIRAAADPVAGRLEIEIADSGAGPTPAAKHPSSGIGLEYARTRLQVLYAGEWRLELRPGDGGSTVSVSLPFRTPDLSPAQG